MKWPKRDVSKWHLWFAWYPVVIGGQYVWMETIERRLGETFCGDYIKYRS